MCLLKEIVCGAANRGRKLKVGLFKNNSLIYWLHYEIFGFLARC